MQTCRGVAARVALPCVNYMMTRYHCGPIYGLQGACPSFFPLPNTTKGAGPAPPGAKQPTHVYLYGDTTLRPASASHRTVLVAGAYTEHGKGNLGTFDAVVSQVSDNGIYYAAKDFWDSKNGQ